MWFVLAALLLLQATCLGQVLRPPCSVGTPPPPPPPGSDTEKTVKNAPLQPAEQGGKWGYIDPAGKFIITPQFDCADPFSDGLAVVEVKKRFGYIGQDGQFLIPPKYLGAGPFKEGFAWVMVRKPWTPLGKGEYGVALFAKFTYIDRSGSELLTPFVAEEVGNFSEGLAAVRTGDTLGGCGSVGYLNTNGEWSIQPQFDEARAFLEGLAAVNRGAKCHMGGKWGYIRKDGNVTIPFRYDYAGQFKNGHACVEEGGRWQIIDTTGTGTPTEKRECLR